MKRKHEAGFSMIEVLITIAILMVGLLGLAGLQTRVATAEFEAYQRAQALVLMQDIMDRMNANKKSGLAAYVQNDIAASGQPIICTGKTGPDLDLCQFNNELIGASEKSVGGANVGAMIGARACITNPAANIYVVTIVWQGLSGTAAPATLCGKDQYGDDKMRRSVSMPLRVATLTVT